MPFVDEILKYKSVSIVGMEKNTGKTECLNYILRRLGHSNHRLAITSIGLDGEGLDQVTQTHKPEIFLTEGDVFVTSEAHFRSKKLDAEILDLSKQRTSLGRLVTARVTGSGKVMISGPSETFWIKKLIDGMAQFGVETTLVDGALSRQSLGSPAITESMVLATGAALSANMHTLVSKTAFLHELICLPQWKSTQNDKLLQISSGLWSLDADGEIHDLGIESAFLLESNKEKLFTYGHTFYVSGAVTAGLLNFLRMQPGIEETVIIARDFSRIFADKESYQAFTKRGGQIKVLLHTKLIAVCVNPVSPQGYILDSKQLREKLTEKLGIPVYDIFKL
jgi:hypothetical protein